MKTPIIAARALGLPFMILVVTTAPLFQTATPLDLLPPPANPDSEAAEPSLSARAQDAPPFGSINIWAQAVIELK